MIWLTNPSPDFDVEKRRRLYALVMGITGASAIIAIMLIATYLEGVFASSEDPLWQVAAIIFGLWFFVAVLLYVAAYAIWYKPYASRLRAITLSLCATLAVYCVLIAGGIFFSVMRGIGFEFQRALTGFLTFHQITYGAPYFTAALTGWFFARNAPDAREQF